MNPLAHPLARLAARHLTRMACRALVQSLATPADLRPESRLMLDPHPLGGIPPWRTGRKVGRTVYDADDVLIGVMDSPLLAEWVVEAVNGWHRVAADADRVAGGRDDGI